MFMCTLLRERTYVHEQFTKYHELFTKVRELGGNFFCNLPYLVMSVCSCDLLVTSLVLF